MRDEIHVIYITYKMYIWDFKKGSGISGRRLTKGGIGGRVDCSMTYAIVSVYCSMTGIRY